MDGSPPTSDATRRAGTAVRWYQDPTTLVGLGIAALVGLAVRLWSVLSYRPTCDTEVVVDECRALAGDALYYFGQGAGIADGHWWIDPRVEGVLQPGAGDPPLFSLFLGILNTLGIDTFNGQRIATSILGVVGVVLVGLLARRLAGRRAGIIAAGIAAVYPMLWINDGQLMAESLFIPVVVLVLWASYRVYANPTVGRAAAWGAILAVAALTRGEGLLWFVVLGAFVFLGSTSVPFTRRIALLAVGGTVGALLISPWVLYNMSRFEEPTTMTTGAGSIMLSGSCDSTYHGATIGYYSFRCLQLPADELPVIPPGSDESVNDVALRPVATEYIQDNLDRLPVVAAVRVGRVWEVYRPAQNVDFNARFENRGRAASQAGLVGYYVLLPLAVAGLVILRRRRVPIGPFLAFALVATATAALTFGVTRYRVPIDVALPLLAATAIDAVIASMQRRRSRRGDAWEPSPPRS